MDKQAIYDAYSAGQLAAYDRVAITANPYEYCTYTLYDAWREGWNAETASQLEHEAAMDRQRARCW